MNRQELEKRIASADQSYRLALERADSIAYYGRANHRFFTKGRLLARWKAQEIRDNARRTYGIVMDHLLRQPVEPDASVHSTGTDQ
jgi:hypothetical protein